MIISRGPGGGVPDPDGVNDGSGYESGGDDDGDSSSPDPSTPQGPTGGSDGGGWGGGDDDDTGGSSSGGSDDDSGGGGAPEDDNDDHSSPSTGNGGSPPGMGDKDLDSGSAGGNSSGSDDSPDPSTPQGPTGTQPDGSDPPSQDDDTDVSTGNGASPPGMGDKDLDSGSAGGNASGSGPEPTTPQGPTGTQPDGSDPPSQQPVPDPDGVNDGSGYEADGPDDPLVPSTPQGPTGLQPDGDQPPSQQTPDIRTPEDVADPAEVQPGDYVEGSIGEVSGTFESTDDLAGTIQEQSGLDRGEDFTVSRSGDSFDVSYTESYQRAAAAEEVDQQYDYTSIGPGDINVDSGEVSLTEDARSTVRERQTAAELGVGAEDISLSDGGVTPVTEAGATALASYAASQDAPGAEDIEYTQVAPGVFRATVTDTAGNVQPSSPEDLTSTAATPEGEQVLENRREYRENVDVSGVASRMRDTSATVDALQEAREDARDKARDRVIEGVESRTGADLGREDVEVSRTTEDGETRFQGHLSDSGEAAVERELETSTFTAKAPEALPVIGGASVTASGRTSNVEVDSGPGGTDVETTERDTFGSWGGAWGTWESTVEGATGVVADATEGASDFLSKGRSPFREAAYEQVTGEDAPDAVSGGQAEYAGATVEGVGSLVEGAGTVVTEGPELAYAAATRPGEVGRAAPGALTGSAAAGASYAAENPTSFAGQMVGGAAVSGGAVSALQGTRLAGATRFAASPVGGTVRRLRSADTPDVRGTASDMWEARDRFMNDESSAWRGGSDVQDIFGRSPSGDSETETGGDSDGGSGLMDRLSDELDRFERGQGIRDAKRRAEERMLNKAQERNTADDAETKTVDTRPGGDYTSPGGPGGDYTAPRGPSAAQRRSRSGPTASQRQAWGRRGSSRTRDIRQQAEAREVEAGTEARFGTMAAAASLAGASTAALGMTEAAQEPEVGAALDARSRAEPSTDANVDIGYDTGIGIVTEYETESVTETGTETGTATETGTETGTATETGTETETGYGYEPETEAEAAAETETAVNVGFERSVATETTTDDDRRRRRQREREPGFELAPGGSRGETSDRPGLGYLGETFAALAGVDYEAAAARTTRADLADQPFGEAQPVYTDEQASEVEETFETIVPGFDLDLGGDGL